MHFSYATDIQHRFPDRRTGILHVTGVCADADVSAPVAAFWDRARKRLSDGTEGAFPEIQAWRRTFKAMGHKPTQYRCASEALLRRFRKEDALPPLHPLVDLCNAASVAFAIPVAVFDLDHVAGDLMVRAAQGDETYASFSGEMETPPAGEVIFADDASHAHARRWANRQSRLSAVGRATTDCLIVAEALHETAQEDIAQLIDGLAAALQDSFGTAPVTATLNPADAFFDTSAA